jgi:hypothetical protein
LPVSRLPRGPSPDVRYRDNPFFNVRDPVPQQRPAAVRHYDPESAGRCIPLGNRPLARVP